MPRTINRSGLKTTGGRYDTWAPDEGDEVTGRIHRKFRKMCTKPGRAHLADVVKLRLPDGTAQDTWLPVGGVMGEDELVEGNDVRIICVRGSARNDGRRRYVVLHATATIPTEQVLQLAEKAFAAEAEPQPEPAPAPEPPQAAKAAKPPVFTAQPVSVMYKVVRDILMGAHGVTVQRRFDRWVRAEGADPTQLLSKAQRREIGLS